jgi:hypothetical protein
MDPAKVAAVKVISLQSIFLQKLRNAALKDNQWQAIRMALRNCKSGLDPAFSVSEGMVFFKNRWYVPEGRDLRREIFSQNHDSWIAGHFRQLMTADKIKANFYRPNMGQDIGKYVSNCDSCQRNKTARYNKY